MLILSFVSLGSHNVDYFAINFILNEFLSVCITVTRLARFSPPQLNFIMYIRSDESRVSQNKNEGGDNVDGKSIDDDFSRQTFILT